MPVIVYSGMLTPRVGLFFKGDDVPGSKATAITKNFLYRIANESLHEFTITGKVDGREYLLKRKATPSRNYYDSALNAFMVPNVSAADLNALLDPGASVTWKIDIKFVYKVFFYRLLEYMTSTKMPLNNFANPASQDEILNTINYTKSGDRVTVRYTKTKNEYWQNIPLKLADKQIIYPGSGPPHVRLKFELDFLTGLSDAKREAMRKLVAMDYTKLLKWGKPPLPDFAKEWFLNVFNYLINHTDFSRGQKIKEKLFTASRTLTAVQISSKLRNDIDKWIITANHWAQRREDWNTERYQKILSDALGTIFAQTKFASPVILMRNMRRVLSLSNDDYAQLILQYGMGNCGEHGWVSFSILKDIASLPASGVRQVVRTGNANIDHGFVIYGLDVKKVIRTFITNNKNQKGAVGTPVDVWDLRQTLADNPGKTGYVMDPYLAQGQISTTADRLLISLNSSRQKSKHLDTDFLAFVVEYPSAYTTETRPGVKNV